MKRRYKVLLIAVPAALVLTAGITAGVLAAPRSPNAAATAVARPADADYAAWGCPLFKGEFGSIASLLNATPAEIATQLQQGKSLVDIAASANVTEPQLIDAILAPMKTFMQQKVTSGAWTQAQMDARLQAATQRVTQIVETKGLTFNNGVGFGCGAGRGMMGGRSGIDTDDIPGPTNGNTASNGLGGMMGHTSTGFRGMMGRN